MRESRPHRAIGLRLKTLRERAKESLLEVSGAVEVDVAVLQEIEAGKRLPDEDILLMLINHFNVPDQESVKLWELAGYSKSGSKEATFDDQLLKQITMVIPFDNRVAYTDTVQVNANQNGLSIDFMLMAGNQQSQTVARVGMSLECAKHLSSLIATAVKYANNPKTPKLLTEKQKPSPEPKSNKNISK